MTNPISILYTSYDGLTDSLGQSQILPYLIGLSQKEGYRFHIISCEKAQRFEQDKAKILSITKAAGIEWHPMPYTKKPPILSTVFDLVKMYFLAKKIVRQNNIKLVHSRSIVSALVGFKIAKKFNLKFIYDMRGFYADERVDGNLWNIKNPLFNVIYKYFKSKETQCINESDYSVCLTHAGKSELYRWENVKPDAKIDVIPCCADLNVFNPANVSASIVDEFRELLQLKKEDIVLTYLGSLGTWYMLDEMLIFFKSFLQQFPNASFLFINKDDEPYIRNRAAHFNIEDKIKIKGASREEVPVLLSLSTYSIFFIKPSYSKIASSPTKQGEIMAMGIPLICNDKVGDTSDIVRKYHAGVVVTDVQKQDFTAEVVALKTASINITEIQQGAREIFSLKEGIEMYARLYRKVLNV